MAIKKTTAAALLLVITVLAAVLAVLLLSHKSGENAWVRITVLDGFSDAPLQNATVVIPEANITCKTDTSGRTPRLAVPVLYDNHFSGIVSQPWGTVTVLVYCEGYVDYALFYAQVQPGKERGNLEILMFESSSESSRPFNIIEGPDRKWAEDVLNKYRP